MSVRPIQADDVRSAAEAASRFTLRGVVTSETLGLAAPREELAKPPPQVVNASKLKFSLGARPPIPVAAPVAAAAPQRPAIVPRKTDSHEIMRLTAYVDDLSKRLRETGSKLKNNESALQRSNQALVAERHTAQKKLGALKTDLDAAHETEAKLRSELGALTAKQQVTKENKEFLSSVRSAIATDAIEESKVTQAKELDQRIAAMQDQQLQLEAHIAALSLDKSTADRELAVANEVVAATQKKSMSLTEKMAQQEERLVAMATLAPDETQQPEVATGDLLMMETSNCCEEESLPIETQRLFSQAPTTSHNKTPILGDAPERVASASLSQNARSHANRSLPGAFVAHHFNSDAPVNLCDAATTGGAPDQGGMSKLINAIVTDIRSLLEHSKSEAEIILAENDFTPPPLR